MNIEKEYKKLQESTKLAADASFKLSEQVYNLKAENERLKEQLAEIGKSWGEIQQMRKETTELKAEYERLEKDKIGLHSEIRQLERENELLKTQYNCYACGNCKGKEDYINLEKHHKGLRKQFDKKVQTLQEIKKVHQWILDQWELDTKEVQNKILDLITKAEEE